MGSNPNSALATDDGKKKGAHSKNLSALLREVHAAILKIVTNILFMLSFSTNSFFLV